MEVIFWILVETLKLHVNKKMTQNDLAIKANISRSYLADVEGNRYNPSIETLDSIARALDVQIGTLLSDSSKEFFNKKCYIDRDNWTI